MRNLFNFIWIYFIWLYFQILRYSCDYLKTLKCFKQANIINSTSCISTTRKCSYLKQKNKENTSKLSPVFEVWEVVGQTVITEEDNSECCYSSISLLALWSAKKPFSAKLQISPPSRDFLLLIWKSLTPLLFSTQSEHVPLRVLSWFQPENLIWC